MPALHSAAAWAPKHQAVADRRKTCQHSCQGGAECQPVKPPSSPLTCATHMARWRVPPENPDPVPAEQHGTPLTHNDMHGNPPTNLLSSCGEHALLQPLAVLRTHTRGHTQAAEMR